MLGICAVNSLFTSCLSPQAHCQGRSWSSLLKTKSDGITPLVTFPEVLAWPGGPCVFWLMRPQGLSGLAFWLISTSLHCSTVSPASLRTWPHPLLSPASSSSHSLCSPALESLPLSFFAPNSICTSFPSQQCCHSFRETIPNHTKAVFLLILLQRHFFLYSL